MYQLNTVNERMQAESAKALAAQMGYTVADTRPTQAQLRTEVAQSASTTSYKFPVRFNDPGNNTFPTLQLLQQQDIFCAFSVGVFFAVAAAASVSFKLYPYDNQTILTSANTRTAILALWNGVMTITVNNDQLLTAWDVRRHYCAPRTQEQSYVAYSTATAIPLVDSLQGATDGFYPIESGIVINGAAKTDLFINLPGAISTIETNARLVIVFRGQLLQNATTVK